MVKNRCRAGVGVVLLLLLVAAHQALAVPGGLQLRGPEVYKLTWNSRALRAMDLDRDGRTDLALIDNEHARIDLYLQGDRGERAPAQGVATHWEPTLSNERFVVEHVLTGARMYALALGDLNGDGYPDFAYTAQGQGLIVYHQDGAGVWSRAEEIDYAMPSQDEDGLWIGDLNGDGNNELLMVGERALLLFATGPKALTLLHRYPLADEGAYGPRVRDVDGDGRRDILYLIPNSDYSLRVRRQRADGAFGPEEFARLRTPRSGLQAVQADHDGLASFAVVDSASRSLETLAVKRVRDDQLPPPRIYAFPATVEDAAGYALGDLNGDGQDDLCVADGQGAQVFLFLRRGDGGFDGPVAYPSLSGISALSIADSDGDGRGELFVASGGEQAIGVSQLQPGNRLSFPEVLPVSGRPLAMALVSRGDGQSELVAILRQGRERRLNRLQRDGAGRWQSIAERALDELHSDPSGLFAMDVNADGRSDLLVLLPRQAARVWLQGPQGAFSAAESGKGFMEQLDRSRLAVGDLDGDGHAELIVSGKGYARVFATGAQNSLRVVEQINTVTAGAEVAAALPVPGKGGRRVLLYESNSDKLHILERDTLGVFRPHQAFRVGHITPLAAHINANEVLLLGRNRFWQLRPGEAHLDFHVVAHHETELEDMRYQVLQRGDLDGDGRGELVLVDNDDSHLVEILAQRDGQWRSAMHFKLFDSWVRIQ